MEANPNKKLVLFAFVLATLSTGLFFAILLNKQNKIDNPLSKPSQLDFYEFSSLLAKNDYNSLALLTGITDLTGQLQNFNNVSKITNNQISFENSNNKNYYAEYAEPIVLDGGFKILLNFDTQNTESSIILSGQESSQTTNWWQDIIRIYIGYNKDEGKNYLSVHNGQQENSVYYYMFDKQDKSQSIILEFLNQIGSVMIIKNGMGQYLTEINFANDKNLGLENGLFPYSSLKIGVSMAPNSTLILNKLYLYQANRYN